MKSWRALLALLALATPAVAGVSPCGNPTANFLGGVIIGSFAPGAVKLEWSLWEDAATREYRVYRYPSGCNGPACVTLIATVQASGTGAGVKSYSFVDTASAGAWSYRLEVRRNHGASCMLGSTEVLVPSPPPCDTAALCAQVEGSFAAEASAGATAPGEIELRWATHAETGAQVYRLSRFNSAAAADSAAELATINATGACGVVQVHSVSDMPPVGAWTYVLEVLDSGGSKACSLQLPAPASPPSSH